MTIVDIRAILLAKLWKIFAESAERGNVKNLAISFLFVDLPAGVGN
jgi:hypothetical protein